MINQGVFDGTDADEGLIECSGNLFTKDNMGSSSTPQEAAKAKPVSVVVVRLVAKVGLSTPMQEVSTISSPNAIVLEDEAENAAIFLDGWLPNTTNNPICPIRRWCTMPRTIPERTSPSHTVRTTTIRSLPPPISTG